METQETNGKAVAALVLGILSIIVPYLGVVLGIIGIFLSNGSLKEITMSGQGGRGLAVAGRVTSIIGTIIQGLLCLLLIFAIVMSIISYSSYNYY